MPWQLRLPFANDPGVMGAALGVVHVERPDGALRFRRIGAPTSAELDELTRTIAHRVGRLLERRGLVERDAENA